MQNQTAAFWSAIAATFAALSSFLIYRMQLKNYRYSARPDLILENWSRRFDKSSDNEIISFNKIENIGNGTAQHINLNCFGLTDDDRPTYVMSTIQIPVIAKAANTNVDAKITVYWKNIPTNSSGAKHLNIKLRILYWDSAGIRHTKKYNLFIIEYSEKHTVTNPIAPGVMLGSLITISRPVWRLQLFQKFTKIPLIGKAFKDKDIV